MHLHRPPRDVVQHRRHDDLHRGDVLADLAVVVVLVDLPRRVQHEQPELHELGVGVGDVALHELLVGEQARPAVSRLSARSHIMSSAFWARPIVRIAWWMRPPPRRVWAMANAWPSPPSRASAGHAHVLVVDERVGALVQRLAAEADVADDVDAGRVGRARGTSTCPGTALTSGSVTAITMRNDAVLAFDEKNFQPLMTHSSPSCTARVVNMRRVGAGVRLGHRVAGEASRRRAAAGGSCSFCSGGAVVGDDLGVAGVGRLAAEHDRRPLRAAEDLVQQRELELAVALAAELGAEVGGPQPLAGAPRP